METKGRKDKTWHTTNVENLLRHRGGTYYGRFRIGGKRKLICLKTDVFTVAKLRLKDEAAGIERLKGGALAHTLGDPTMADLAQEYIRRYEGLEITEASKRDRSVALKRLIKTWPGFEGLRPSMITKVDIWNWASRLKTEGSGYRPPYSKGAPKKGSSGGSVNRSITALQQMLDLAVESGAIHTNLAREKPPATFKALRKKADPKPVYLPPAETMAALLDEIEKPDARADKRVVHAQKWHRRNAGELCRFLMYTGSRISEAKRATWADDLGSSIIIHGTKSAPSLRTLPMNPPLRALLDAILERRKESAAALGLRQPRPNDPILAVFEAQKSIDRACKALHIERLTNHDFRHGFATRCLEVNIDPKTIAEWLGHSDGGVLVLQTYGHVRKTHSASAAAKLSF